MPKAVPPAKFQSLDFNPDLCLDSWLFPVLRLTCGNGHEGLLAIITVREDFTWDPFSVGREEKVQSASAIISSGNEPGLC